VDAAFAHGFTPKVVPGTRFTLDVDLPQDLATVLAEQPDSQTASYLKNSGIAERINRLTTSQSG
jgi:2-phospho-L-lactate guanylyltransferase (CobY/MobA/RfbA family)